jgi:hypothetical protein
MRGRPFVVSDYSGGVNLEAAPYAVDINQARDLLNVVTSPIGTVKRRNGFTVQSSPTLPITSLGTYERGGTKYLVALGDSGAATDVYSITPAGTVTSRKGAAVITSGRRWEILQAPLTGGQGPIYMINGLDPALQWSGAGNVAAWTASTGTVPNGKYIAYHDNRVLVAGVETDYTTRSTLYASNLADPRDWASPGGVTTLLDPDDGEEITGMGTVGPYAIVFKPSKCFIVTDTDTLAYRNLSDEIGCVSHRTIAPSDQGTFFLTANRTVCVTDGSSINTISTPIEPLLKTASTLSNASGYFWRGSYYLCISIDATNDTILEFNTESASWWIHTIAYTALNSGGATDWAVLDPAGESTLYAAGGRTDTPKVFEAFDSSSFNDIVTYDSFWVTGWQTFDAPHLRKIIRQIRADSKGEFDLFTAKSFASSYSAESAIVWEQAELGSSTFGGAGVFGGAGTFGDTSNQISERRFYTPGTGRAWSLKFQATAAVDWELYSHTLAIDFRTD